jgi:hypothetical protein
LLVVLAGRQLDVQKNEIEKDYAAAAQHQEILKAKEVWEEKDHRYKMYRYRKARELAKLKIRLCCMEQGALNFVERRNLSKERFDRDFNDAMARYRAVAKELRLLYGYVQPDPGMAQVAAQKATLDELSANPFLGKLDLYLNWVRDAIAWLIRFQATEQTYTRVISIRNAPTGSDTWDQGITNGGRWKVLVPETEFVNQSHVRLRGINVYAEMKNTPELWKCTLTPPSQSITRLSDGSTNTIDQSHLPNIFFGRATARESIRLPESGVGPMIHNASPIGPWTLELVSLTKGAQLDGLQDVYIDFDVAVKTAT